MGGWGGSCPRPPPHSRPHTRSPSLHHHHHNDNNNRTKVSSEGYVLGSLGILDIKPRSYPPGMCQVRARGSACVLCVFLRLCACMHAPQLPPHPTHAHHPSTLKPTITPTLLHSTSLLSSYPDHLQLCRAGGARAGARQGAKRVGGGRGGQWVSREGGLGGGRGEDGAHGCAPTHPPHPTPPPTPPGGDAAVARGARRACLPPAWLCTPPPTPPPPPPTHTHPHPTHPPRW